MNDNKLEELLEAIKSYLDYTWEDTARDVRLKSYISSSYQYLQEVANSNSLDLDEDLLARELLFNRVLYMDSKALDDFQSNYNGMLNELRIKYAC